MKPLKFEPLLKSTIWGGNKIIAFSKPVLTIREVKLIEEFLGEPARSIEDVL